MNIGETLRAAREAKGVTVTDASAATRISKKYIQALENDNLLLIPSQVYAKGFLKAYCEYLSLDPIPLREEMVNYFRGVAEAKKQRKVPIGKPSVMPEIKMPNIRLPKLEMPRIILPKITLPQIKINVSMRTAYVLLAGIIVILLALEANGLAFRAYRHFLIHRRNQIVAKANPPLATKVQVKVKAPSVKALQAKTPPVKKKEGGVVPGKIQLRLVITDRAWIQVTSGEMVIFNKTVSPGTQLNFIGSLLTVKTGNGSGVKVYVNGSDLGLMGHDSKPVERTYKAGQ